MRSTTKTRVQRRVEKKQAVILVALVLVISVVSFGLGVVVGRHSGEPAVVQQILDPQRIIVDDNPISPGEPATAAVKPVEEQLTFYENLSKDEMAPIGSGINLPPDTEQLRVIEEIETPMVSGAAEVVASIKVSTPSQAPSQVSAPAAVTAPVSRNVVGAGRLPAVVKGGGWVVQVFASQSAADAGILRDKLGGKGYPAFITEADLGKKGIWYRVLFGPYSEKNDAVQAQIYAGDKDKINGFVKRR